MYGNGKGIYIMQRELNKVERTETETETNRKAWRGGEWRMEKIYYKFINYKTWSRLSTTYET